jgi:DNA replication protein DnaC
MRLVFVGGSTTALADGSLGRMLLRLPQIDVLLLDDFAMAPLKDSERRDFLEVCDDRYQHRSMILTSQMPVAHWHEQIGDPKLPTASSTGCCTTPTA